MNNKIFRIRHITLLIPGFVPYIRPNFAIPITHLKKLILNYIKKLPLTYLYSSFCSSPSKTAYWGKG